MKKIIILLLFFYPLILTGQDYYYVDPAGSDSNSGTSSSDPWLTLHHACSQATTIGDFIHLAAGIYTETAQCVLADGVSLLGIDANSVFVRPASDLTPMIIASSSSSASLTAGNQIIANITFDGNRLTGYGAIKISFRSNVKIYHCTFRDWKYYGVEFNGSASSWNTEPSNTRPINNEVGSCIFYNNSERDGVEAGHVRIEGQDYFLLHDNSFDQTSRTIGDNGNIIAGYQNTRLKIYDNVFTKNDTDGDSWNFFVEMHYTKGEFELFRNVFNGAACYDLSGVEKGSYEYGARIYENIFQTDGLPHNDTEGYFQPYLDLESFYVSSDIYVYRNYFKHSRTAIFYDNMTSASGNFWVYSNIFENTGNADNSYSNAIQIGSRLGDYTPTALSNIYIYNNVIDAGKTTYSGINVRVIGDITNLNIRNNIFNDGFSYAIRFTTDRTPTITGLNINNNIYYGTGGTVSYSPSITYTSRDDSDNLPGTNPLFVSSSDFHLQSGSPAIGAGTYVGLSRDYDNRLWNNPPSIGAYERTTTGDALPILSTSPVLNITETTAISGGSISNDGGTAITARGVCWNTSASPTIANSKTTDGAGTGEFVSSVTGLTNGLTYYLRAYATNSIGTAYGLERVFTTPIPTSSGVKFLEHGGVPIINDNKTRFIKSD
jgi:hypothetical protein